MRRMPRIHRSIDLLRTSSISQNLYVHRCSACRNQTSSFTTSLRGAEKESLSERMKRSLFRKSPSTTSDPSTEPSGLQLRERAQAQKSEREWEPRGLTRAEDAADYVPAAHGSELELIGGPDMFFEERLNAGYPYKLFMRQQKIKDSLKVTAALHRAVVEVFALRQAGKPLWMISQFGSGPDFTENVQISPSQSGAILQFFEHGSLEQILSPLTPVPVAKKSKQERKARITATSPIDETAEKGAPTESEEDVAADRSQVDPLHPESTPTPKRDETVEKKDPTESEEDVAADLSTVDPLKARAEALVASWGNSWLQISLGDPNVKFAVVKRTMQLTGTRIPDNAINSSNTIEKLLQHLITPPKPPTLKQALDKNEELLTLPNVKVFGKRITGLHKEQNIGRLKVIRQEFKARGLL